MADLKPTAGGSAPDLSPRRRLKRFLFDRYFRWEVDALLAPPEGVLEHSFAYDDSQFRIAHSIPGWLDPRNVRLFDYCIQHLPSGAPIVEIGSYCGLSLNMLIQLARKHRVSNTVISVDPWTFGIPEEMTRSTGLATPAYRAYLVESFRRSVELFSRDRLPYHIELDSDQFFERWASGAELVDFFGRAAKLGGPISFAYIDGDHSYEQSRRDFANVDRFLEPGGFVVFDDSADRSHTRTGKIWGSTQTAQEAAALPNYRVIDKSHHYCIQKLPAG